MAYNTTIADLSSGCGRATALPSLAQWDRGQILKISGVELPPFYRVDFSNKGDRTTIPMSGDSNGVEVPNTLLESGKPLLAYIVLSEGEDDREKEYWITINVSPRPKPTDDEPDQGQQAIIDQLIDKMNTAVETSEQNAETAGEHAGAADQSAQDAEAWAVGQRGGVDVGSDDKTYRNNARYYAEQADEVGTEKAKLAESWAVGGTGTRADEDNDNAKHYAQLAAQGAEKSGYAWFDVHDDDGCMYVYISDNLSEDVAFAVNEASGVLEVTYK